MENQIQIGGDQSCGADHHRCCWRVVRLLAYVISEFMKNIFDLSKTKRVPDVIHDGEFDDFGTGFEIFEVIYFSHDSSYHAKIHKSGF